LYCPHIIEGNTIVHNLIASEDLGFRFVKIVTRRDHIYAIMQMGIKCVMVIWKEESVRLASVLHFCWTVKSSYGSN
jgi:hypothetical protein